MNIDTMSSVGSGDEAYSHVIGRIDPAVTGVEVILPRGVTIQATAKGGWWTTWWPGEGAGEVDSIRIVVHTAAGSKTYTQAELCT